MIKCIEKQYKGNEVVAYVLMDEQGNRNIVPKETLKKMMKNKQIAVVNLQLSSDGRLVDKAVKLEEQSGKGNLEQILVKAYEASYKGLLQGGTVAFERYLEGNGQIHSKYYNEMCNIFEKAKMYDKLDALEVAQGFENYIRNKYKCLPMRLSVKLKGGDQRHYICYGMKNIYIPVFGNWYDEGEHNPGLYLNVNNYEINGVCLDGTQATYVRGTNLESNKNYIYIDNDGKQLYTNGTYVIVERGTSKDGKYQDVFIGVEMTKGLTNRHTIVDREKHKAVNGKRSYALNEAKSTLHKNVGVKVNSMTARVPKENKGNPAKRALNWWFRDTYVSKRVLNGLTEVIIKAFKKV